MSVRLLKLIFMVFVAGILLLGCRSQKSSIRTQAEQDSLTQWVKKQIDQKKQYEQFREKVLPRDFEKKIEDYYPAIRKYSKRYGFDWRLIVMQILKESRFREDARSQRGAIGLMQIMPSTALEIRQEMDIDYIANSPRENIAAGIYHLYKQLQYFQDADRDNRIKLALAAYNCGVARIWDAQEIARFLKLDPRTWADVKQCLPRLTARDWRLHLDVWELGVPQYGYFYGSEQTIDYVDDIIRNYQIFAAVYH